MELKDNYRHKGMRRRLIDQLRDQGIEDERILRAFDAVPRHFFLDSAFADMAYANKPFPIGFEQTISQPFTVAYQTHLLEVKKEDKILEIGTGSGFQAAILAEMGARVYTLERQEALYERSRKLLSKLGYDEVRCYFRDGHHGLPHLAPFDKIIVTAGVTEIPRSLLVQLNIKGSCVIPVGNGNQRMYRIKRSGLNDFEKECFGDFKFVPFLKGTRTHNFK